MHRLTYKKKYMHPLLSIMINNLPRLCDTEDREEICGLCNTIITYMNTDDFIPKEHKDYIVYKHRSENAVWDMSRLEAIADMPYSENYMASVHGQMIFLSKGEPCHQDIRISEYIELDDGVVNDDEENIVFDLSAKEINYITLCLKEYKENKGDSDGVKEMMYFIRHAKKI